MAVMSDYFDYVQAARVWERLGWLESVLRNGPDQKEWERYAKRFAEQLAREEASSAGVR
jgi:hypothetical protein